MKDPRISASPSSGNTQNIDKKENLASDNFFGTLEKDNNQKPIGSNLILVDGYDTKKATVLQRPCALLHYDYEQVRLVILRSKTRKVTHHLYGRSLFIFGPDNLFRKFISKVTNFWFFEWFIIFLILVSTVTLAFEHPLENPESDKVHILGQIDLVMTSIFCLEALMKIISLGFLFNGSKSYLFDSWNILDFMIVTFSVVSLAVDTNLSFIKVLRVARILRPLRLI